MKNQTMTERYERAIRLIGKGMTAKQACQEAGISAPTFYKRKKEAQAQDWNVITEDAATEEQTIHATTGSRLDPLWKQIAASNLSATTKMKLLLII